MGSMYDKTSAVFWLKTLKRKWSCLGDLFTYGVEEILQLILKKGGLWV